MIFKREGLPDLLKPLYFDFHWSQAKLWALPLEARSMPISDFAWLLELPIWASAPPDHLYDLCPATVLQNLDRYPKHRQRIDAADPAFPMHVMQWKDRWVIMDGFHRLLKLMRGGQTLVQVYEVPASLIPEIQPDPDLPSGFLRQELARREGRD